MVRWCMEFLVVVIHRSSGLKTLSSLKQFIRLASVLVIPPLLADVCWVIGFSKDVARGRQLKLELV